MPQGGIDAREDPAQAALRELEEETGIRSVSVIAEAPGWYFYDLPENVRPKAWGGRYRGQRQKWFAMRFHGSDTEIALARPGHAQEFDAWRWAEVGELAGLIVPFKRPVYEQVVREFEGLAQPYSGA
jgi:putative (di)nucleoside polyphosphate hydrolase